MKNAVVWWEPEISTGLPFSTLKGLAFGPRPPALQYVDIFYLVRPCVLPIRSNPRVPLERLHLQEILGLNSRIDDAARFRGRR